MKGIELPKNYLKEIPDTGDCFNEHFDDLAHKLKYNNKAMSTEKRYRASLKLEANRLTASINRITLALYALENVIKHDTDEEIMKSQLKAMDVYLSLLNIRIGSPFKTKYIDIKLGLNYTDE